LNSVKELEGIDIDQLNLNELKVIMLNLLTKAQIDNRNNDVLNQQFIILKTN